MIQTWTCRLCGGHLMDWEQKVNDHSIPYREGVTKQVIGSHYAVNHFNELIEVTTKEDDNEVRG